MSKLNLTCDDIEKASRKLVKKLKKYGFHKNVKNTLVLGIGRGGLIAAQYVAYGLGIRNISTIQSKLYKGKSKNEKEMTVSGVLTLDYEAYDTIIIVDDLIDTGVTMDVIIELLENTSAAFGEDILIIPSALYSQIPEKKLEAIIGKELPKDKKGNSRWVNFPWDTFMNKKKA